MVWIHQSLVTLTKLFSHAFFRVETRWVGGVSPDLSSEDVRLIVLLNHTSLFEPLYLAAFPFSFVWRMVPRTVVPGADNTLARPWVGRFLKLLIPGLTPVTRKRDESWDRFLMNVGHHSVVLLAAEGRMRRRNGLDKEGKPLTVKGGVADLLLALPKGKMLLLYSGGLHHVQSPGEFRLGLFKRLHLTLELVDIDAYRKDLGTGPNFRETVKADLERRKGLHILPATPEQKPPA